jgi:ankyrin repeat protein
MSKRFLLTLILSGVTALVMSGCGGDLHKAARDNSLTAASSLIDSGADIEAKNDDGYTALQEAAWKNSLDVARLLIERGAKTEGIDLSSMN